MHNISIGFSPTEVYLLTLTLFIVLHSWNYQATQFLQLLGVYQGASYGNTQDIVKEQN